MWYFIKIKIVAQLGKVAVRDPTCAGTVLTEVGSLSSSPPSLSPALMAASTSSLLGENGELLKNLSDRLC